ncbi:hypothetical protein BAY06_04675 [Elizabethkingia anophelis]|uniref:hypothetical protein n=1 Tax=Elizabethkingia anophelis TaxID=1117645 RepID=UPI0009994E91|nr:hypothetical protein [Elizabethkingia anophelis]OPC51623.1 hypothetical protein BAY06_04675 [Elizabethkingia anophelis]
MTAIVGVLNSQGIAIAADSAVTVTGNNSKKVYNRSNKIFTLSKYHPVGIAIYSSANFLGIPLETLIKMYRKELVDKSFDSILEYKTDFIRFAKSKIGNVSKDVKRNTFYGICSFAYKRLIENTLESLYDLEINFDELPEAERNKQFHEIFSQQLQKLIIHISSFDSVQYCSISFEDYNLLYKQELREIENYIINEIKLEVNNFNITQIHKDTIKDILYSLINIEFIFEIHCGLVFFGFGEEEIFPSSHNILIGGLIGDELRIRDLGAVEIQPGTINSSNIIPYAQGDVTTTVLTGVDPNYKSEVHNAIKQGFENASTQIANLIENQDLSDQIKQALSNISDELVNGLDNYQRDNITGPLLDTLASMGKEDMSELAESLVNITSLKRKFTSLDSTDESVGGPVDVAIVTKGDGFIWIKRKHYFDLANNPSFIKKYFEI